MDDNTSKTDNPTSASTLMEELIENKISVFEYSASDFSIITSDLRPGSKFDKVFGAVWEEKHEKGILRYKVDYLPTKIVGEAFSFVLQLNTKRLTRRRPEYIDSTIIPFKKENFHFGKIPKDEIVFLLHNRDWVNSNLDFISDSSLKLQFGKHAIVVNNSPIGRKHCLLCPFVDKGLPQILLLEPLILAVETLLLTHKKGIRVAFNSLGGNASVNHLHFHIYELKETLYTERACIFPLAKELYTFKDYPGRGFIFLIEDDISNYLSIIQNVMKLINYLQSKKLAHNVFITKAQSSKHEVKDGCEVYYGLRIHVWVRKSCFGIKKEHTADNPTIAVCELAGHFILCDDTVFDEINEEKHISNLLLKETDSFYNEVLSDVTKLYA